MKMKRLAMAVGLSVSTVLSAATLHPVDQAFLNKVEPFGITQQNWDSGKQAKLTLKNAYRFTPHMSISKGNHIHHFGGTVPFNLNAIQARDLDGSYDLETLLRDRLNVESLVITRNGKLISEYYWNGTNQDSTHLQMSVSKSFTAITASILAAEGKIDMTRQVTDYLPELKASPGFSRATVQEVADMRSGINIEFSEGKIWDDRMTNVQNWNGENQYPELVGILDFAKLVNTSQKQPGTQYDYQCINTEVLGKVVERVSGKPLADVIENKLWHRVGFEHDAKWMGNEKGEIVASGGLNATTRDINRMMFVLVNGGKNHIGEQVVPKTFIDNILAGNREVQNAWHNGKESKLLSDGWYKDQIRVLNVHGHTFMAFVGIHGQVTIGEPETGIVISMNGAQEEMQAPRTVLMTFTDAIPALLDAVKGLRTT